MAKRTAAEAASASRVKAVNNAYYKALSDRDMRAMEKVWTCATDNILIAPPINPVTHVGWEAIKRNWEAYWPTFTVQRFHGRNHGQYQRTGGLGAWRRDVEPARENRRPE